MKLNYRRTFFIGLAFLSISCFWQLYDNIIPLILKETFDIGETNAGIIMAMDNVLALFLLPFFGTLSDKTDTRLGKRIPFILAGTLVSVIFMLLIPIADQQNNFLLFIISLGIVLLAMGAYRSPAVALMPDLTPKSLRSKANAVINLMGAVGGIVTLLLIKFLIPKGEHPNYFIIYFLVAIIMVIAVVLLIITIRENKLVKELKINDMVNDQVENDQEENNQADNIQIANNQVLNDQVEINHVDRKVHNQESAYDMSKSLKISLTLLFASIFLWFTAYNAVTSAFSRYAYEVWNLKEGGFANCLLVATGAAIISFIPIGIIASHIGRKKTIIGGIILITFSYLSGCFFFEYSNTVQIVFAFTGIGWAAINVNSYPMVVEMSKGSDVGKYTGMYYTFSMTAQILTPILSGFLMEHISYRVLFPYAVIFSLASLVTMLMVKHGDT